MSNKILLSCLWTDLAKELVIELMVHSTKISFPTLQQENKFQPLETSQFVITQMQWFLYHDLGTGHHLLWGKEGGGITCKWAMWVQALAGAVGRDPGMGASEFNAI